MSVARQARFQWSVAWLMSAVGLVGASPAALTHVLRAADGLQHAILTREELNGAIARLSRANYLRYTIDVLELTSEGRDLVVRAASDTSRANNRQHACDDEITQSGELRATRSRNLPISTVNHGI